MPDWPSAARCPGIQPTVEIAVRRWVMPRSGRRSQAASTVSRFIIGSPMPMKTTWSSRVASRRRKCSAWSRISPAVRLRPKRIAAGRAERAGERAARLRGDAHRAAAVAVAHQHRLERAAVGGAQQRLDRAVAGDAARARARASRAARRSASASRSASGQVGHLGVGGGAARHPAHTWRGAVSAARRARRASGASAVSRSIGCDPMVAASCASPSTSPTPASPRAAPPRRSIRAGRVTRRRRRR